MARPAVSEKMQDTLLMSGIVAKIAIWFRHAATFFVTFDHANFVFTLLATTRHGRYHPKP